MTAESDTDGAPVVDPDASKPGLRLNAVLAGLLPGLLAGTLLSGLLFFLNPHLDFEPRAVLRGVAFYGLLLGLCSLVLLGPFFAHRPERIRRWLPLGLTLVLALAALGAWIHASELAFFLPQGINRRLIKAAIALSVAAVVCFYTALVHQMRQRPYGRRSYLLFFLMALLAVYVVFERREAFRPYVRPEPRATLFEESTRPTLLVVGVEAATLDAILPLAEQGRLPFFSSMLQEGTQGRLQSLSQLRRSALWATVLVGKHPYRHGVVGDLLYRSPAFEDGAELRLLPLGLGLEHWGFLSEPRTVEGQDLGMRPLWEILSHLGLSTAVVGWPLVSPDSETVDVVLSEAFFEQGDEGQVSPEALVERARLFRTRLDEIDPVYSSRFGPSPPAVVLAAMARDQWRLDLAQFLLDQQPATESLFLMLPGLEAVSQEYFGGFASAQFDGAQDPESVEAAQLLSAYYSHVDQLLEQLWDLTPEPKLLVVTSVYGVEGPSGLREAWRRLLRKPAVAGYRTTQSDGLILLRGEGIRAGGMLRSANLVDLAPTLLYGMGLPIARDSDGVVLTDAFDGTFLARQPLTLVPSYETLAVVERNR